MNAQPPSGLTTRWATALRVLLLLVLLAGQSAAFAHEFEHALPAHDSACLSCSAGHNLQAAGTATAPPEAARTTALPPEADTPVTADTRFLAAYRGRAPPASVTH